MWILEEGQILPYLRSHYPVFDQSGPVDIQCIGALEGEEKPREPDEGGLINYIFRVSNGKQSVIVKQGRSASRKNDKIVLPIWRNRQEYETLRLRHAIVPQYTPETYYVDWENAIFLMEDVSDLAQVRKLLCSGVMLPRLAEQVGNLLRRAPLLLGVLSGSRPVSKTFCTLPQQRYAVHHGRLGVSAGCTLPHP
ncbi:MAG: hypothetical protein ACLRIS_10430 [Flavonifractor plautii]